MNCRDFRQVKPLHLFLQMQIMGHKRDFLAQFRRDLTTQFRSSSFGKSNDQKIIQIRRVVRIHNVA